MRLLRQGFGPMAGATMAIMMSQRKFSWGHGPGLICLFGHFSRPYRVDSSGRLLEGGRLSVHGEVDDWDASIAKGPRTCHGQATGIEFFNHQLNRWLWG